MVVLSLGTTKISEMTEFVLFLCNAKAAVEAVRACIQEHRKVCISSLRVKSFRDYLERRSLSTYLPVVQLCTFVCILSNIKWSPFGISSGPIKCFCQPTSQHVDTTL